MRQKLEELKAEFEKGQQQMATLDQKRGELRDTMLRISGAIQVLEELLASDEQQAANRQHLQECAA
jgi:prefoldin subunit 5